MPAVTASPPKETASGDSGKNLIAAMPDTAIAKAVRT